MDSWRVLQLGDRSCLVKHTFGNSTYEIFITDYEQIYGEKIEKEETITERSKTLNPKIEAPAQRLLAHIAQKLEEREKDSTISLNLSQKSPSEILLCLKTDLRGLPFAWEFHCTQLSSAELGTQMVIPLVVMVGELLRRQGELQKFLTKKDREIEDYKMSGSRVSRKNLETVPFSTDSFAKEMNASAIFDAQVRGYLNVFEKEACQELYHQVMEKRAVIIQKLEEGASLSSLDVSMEDRRLSTFPASSFISPNRPTSRTSISPNPKSIALASPPAPVLQMPPPPSSAEAEKKARESIRRRLEEEVAKEKTKKKKKKVI